MGMRLRLFVTLFQRGTWLFGGRTHCDASTRLTPLSGPTCAAQVPGATLSASIPSPENAPAGFFCGMDGLFPQICDRPAQSRGTGPADHPAPPCVTLSSIGAAGALSGLEGHALCVCQTAPAIPPQPDGNVGKTWARADHGRGALPVA